MPRRKAITLIIIIISMFILISCGPRRPDSWREYNALGIKYMRHWHYDDAEQAFKLAISVARKTYGSGTVKEVISNLYLANCYYWMGDDSLGANVAARALAMLDSPKVEIDASSALEFMDVADRFVTDDIYREAALVYHKLEPFCLDIFGDVSTEHYDLLYNYAKASGELEKYDQADSLWREVLRLHEQLKQPIIDLCLIYDKMAESRDGVGEEHEADSLYDLADEVCYSNVQNLSNMSAKILVYRADRYYGNYDYDQAEHNYNRALTIFKANRKKVDDELLRIYANLAEIYRLKGDLAKADSMFNLVGDINSADTKFDRYTDFEICLNKVHNLENLDRLEEAEILASECLKIATNKEFSSADNYCQAFYTVGRIKRLRGKYDEAGAMLQAADSIAENESLNDVMMQGLVYNELALLETNLENYNEAESYIYNAIDNLIDEDLEISAMMGLFKSNLAYIRKEQGNYVGLDTLYKEVFELYDGFSQTWCKNRAAEALDDWAKNCYHQADNNGAFAKCGEAIEYLKARSLDNTPAMAQARYSLGELYKLNKMYDEAEMNLKGAAAIFEQYPDAYNYDLERVYRLIACIHIRKNNTNGAADYNEKAAILREKMYGDSTLVADE